MYRRWSEVDGRGEPTAVAVARGRLPVLRVRYGKDFMALRVRNHDGVYGWIDVGRSLSVSQPSSIAVQHGAAPDAADGRSPVKAKALGGS